MTVAMFAELVAGYCWYFHGSVTSWGRTAKRNAVVGGVEASAHQFFRAVDIVYDELPDLAFRRGVAERLGLLLLDEGDHDHLQPLDWQAG